MKKITDSDSLTSLKKTIGFVLLTLISFSNISCNKNVKDGKICALLPVENARFGAAGVAINGDELPYYSVYIDEDNYSEIIGVRLSINEDGTWDSMIMYWENVKGTLNYKSVERDGTYDCVAAGVALQESDGVDAGIFTQNSNSSVDADWVLISGNSEYYF